MKKIFSTFFVLVTLLAMTTGSAFAGSALKLVEVRIDKGVPTFIFSVMGEFSREELESGFVSVQGGEKYPLYCAQRDEETVLCHTSKNARGHAVVVGFGGASFSAKVPDETVFCESIYDLDQGLGPNAWAAFGEVCTSEPSELGDTYVTYNPYVMQPNWTYYFLLAAPSGWNDPGQGYYPIVAN